MTACRGCGGPVEAKPGYESRTFYCSRRCEDRAYRRRTRQDAEEWRNENRILIRAVESLNAKLRASDRDLATAREERDHLAEALGYIAVKAGVVDDVPLTGPQLLLVAGDVEQVLASVVSPPTSGADS